MHDCTHLRVLWWVWSGLLLILRTHCLGLTSHWSQKTQGRKCTECILQGRFFQSSTNSGRSIKHSGRIELHIDFTKREQGQKWECKKASSWTKVQTKTSHGWCVLKNCDKDNRDDCGCGRSSNGTVGGEESAFRLSAGGLGDIERIYWTQWVF